jgi:uncharacterized damage-inducible protein DinB
MDSRAEIRDTIWRLLNRDLDAVRQEIAAYPDDESLWRVEPGISNSGGTLALHLAGNLRHFIGAALGESGFVRDRPTEFSTRGLSRDAVIAELADAQQQVATALMQVDLERLDDTLTEPVMNTRPTQMVFLLHLCTHLSYHLGQVDYHRRLITGLGTTVNTIHVPALAAPLPT